MRELRQHASRYLARVARGESLEVTDRGRAVARLVPIRGDAYADLVASGRLEVADEATDIAEEAPSDYGVDAAASLEALRSDER